MPDGWQRPAAFRFAQWQSRNGQVMEGRGKRQTPYGGTTMPTLPSLMPTWADFDLTNGLNILRLICGLFFIPHIVGKFTEPATLNFFKAAKFDPPATWMYFAGTIECFLTVGLVFAIATPYVAAPRRLPSCSSRRPRPTR